MKTVKELAEKYQVTPMTIHRWIEDGNLERNWKKIVGKKPFIVLDEKEVEEYLKSKGTVWG